LLLVGALTMTACDGGTKATNSAPSPSGVASASAAPLPSYATAQEELAAGFARTVATTSVYTVDSFGEGEGNVNSTMTGVSDPARHAVSGKSHAEGAAMAPLEITVIGDDLYGRGGTLSVAEHWTHMKLSRAPRAAALGFPGVVLSVASAGGAIADAEKVRPFAFKGTLDPAKADRAAVIYNANAKPFPFEVTLDAQGYVTTLVLHTAPMTDGLKAVTVTVHLTDFGKPVTIAAPPASEVKEISEDAYRLYGGS
jgi:hypothetical protein